MKMLQPIIKQLNSKRIILASSSPRRKEMLANIGLNVELCPSLFEENLEIEQFSSFADFVEETALQKVLEVSKRLYAQENECGDRQRSRPDIIIGADTMVTLDNKMYGKPKTKENAVETLRKLMGRTNVVYTGVAIKYGDKIHKFTETTEVTFGKFDDAHIKAYVDTGEPMDKAGAYGIQHIGSTFIEKINGDFYTVMGLPLYRLALVLRKLYEENNNN